MKNRYYLITIVLLFINITAYSQLDQKLLTCVVSLRQEVTIETIKNPVFDKDDNLVGGSIIDKKVDIISRGSGTIISSNGLILTNYHVWNFDVKVTKDQQKKFAYRYSPTMDDMYVYMIDPDNVFKEPKKKYLAKYLGGDKSKDIAILKCYYNSETGQRVQNLNLNFMPLGNPFGIGLNNKIIIAGYPSIGGSTITVTDGKFLGYYNDQNCTIKTDAAISYGNSGGAAVFYDKIFGIPTAVSTQQGGANFGYINPVTFAVGPLAKIKIKYKENIPNIDRQWLENTLNSENTKNNQFIGFQIRSAMSNQLISGARIIIHRLDRDYTEIESLFDEIQKIYTIYLIQEYKNNGYTIKNTAKLLCISEADVKTALNLSIDKLPMSDDANKLLNNKEFFFVKGDSDKDGFYFTTLPVPKGQKFKLIITSENYKKIERVFQSDYNPYMDLGIILLY